MGDLRHYTLTGPDGRPYASPAKGTWGGHRGGKIYGRLDCPAALRAIAKGSYVKDRVFFADEQTAIAAGYRPCGACCKERYHTWKAAKDFGESWGPDQRPDAVLIPGWLTLDQQEWIVGQFNRWAEGPVPIRAAKVRGHEMSVRTVCLGWHWQPYKYTREATDVNGARVLPFPDWMVGLGRRALRETGYADAEVAEYTPDTALVNYYDDTARLGMHQDKDERSLAPVVSLSIGDACTFRFGNTENRNKPYADLQLGSGDLFVFGGASRLAYHGVTRVHPFTAPDGCGLDTGRINITMRMTGLTD